MGHIGHKGSARTWAGPRRRIGIMNRENAFEQSGLSPTDLAGLHLLCTFGTKRGTPVAARERRSALTPDVLFIEDVARMLRTSRSTIERRRRAGTFPIPELPGIDGRPRWSRQAVERYLESTNEGKRPRRGRRPGRGR